MRANRIIRDIEDQLADVDVPAPPTASTPTPAEILQVIALVWPVVVLALRLAMIFTGDKWDEKFERVIAWGNLIPKKKKGGL